MKTTMMLLLIPLALIGPALAHNPPGPHLTCQNTWVTGDTSGYYHDYGPALSGTFIFPLMDGNLADCPKPNPIEFGVFSEMGTVCTTLGGAGANPGAPVCGSVDTGVDQPLYDYDGEPDYGGGGAFLFVNTGDGVTSGVTACYGWPSVGHHTASIYAQDILGHGPVFIVTADYSLTPPLEGPDCGDNVINPCDGPPAPSPDPFPVNMVVDTVNQVLQDVLESPGTTCDPNDHRAVVASTAVGPSHITVTFGPGIDGAYTVFVRHDFENNRFATAGHVWTPF